MTVANLDKAKIVADYQRSATDTGSPEVQVALLTARIVDLTDVISKEVRRSLPYRRALWRFVYRVEQPRIERYERTVARSLEESWLIDPGEYAKSLSAEWYHPEFHALTDETLQNLRSHQIKINAWTIDEETDMRKAVAMKLDGVITNHPDTFARILQEYQTK